MKDKLRNFTILGAVVVGLHKLGKSAVTLTAPEGEEFGGLYFEPGENINPRLRDNGRVFEIPTGYKAEAWIGRKSVKVIDFTPDPTRHRPGNAMVAHGSDRINVGETNPEAELNGIKINYSKKLKKSGPRRRY